MSTVEHELMRSSVSLDPATQLVAEVMPVLPATPAQQEYLRRQVTGRADRPCLGRVVDEHYPPAGDPRVASARMLARHRATAAALCAGCPVQIECAALELSTGTPWGVWGGRCEWDLRAAAEELHSRGYRPPQAGRSLRAPARAAS